MELTAGLKSPPKGGVIPLLDEVDRARRAEQLEADFGVALEKVADDGSEEFGVHRSGRAQESPRRLLQPAQRPLGLFDLSDDARAVVVIGPAGVREAQLASRALQESRLQPRLQLGHL